MAAPSENVPTIYEDEQEMINGANGGSQNLEWLILVLPSNVEERHPTQLGFSQYCDFEAVPHSPTEPPSVPIAICAFPMALCAQSHVLQWPFTPCEPATLLLGPPYISQTYQAGQQWKQYAPELPSLQAGN